MIGTQFSNFSENIYKHRKPEMGPEKYPSLNFPEALLFFPIYI